MARHPALRLRRRAAGRHRQSARRGARRLRRRHHREPRRRLSGRHRAQADGGAGHHRLGAGGETVGPAGPHRAEQGVADGAQRRCSADPGAGSPSRCVPTFLLSNYHLFQLTMVIVYAIAILGLAILTGFNGQISLGHGAFYAIGAYVTAVLMYKYDVPYWATLPASAVVCCGRRLPDRPARAAAGRAVPRADHLRACRRRAAASEARRPRALDRRRAGARHRQTRPAVRPGPVAGPVALPVLACSSARCCSCWRGTSCAGASGAR